MTAIMPQVLSQYLPLSLNATNRNSSSTLVQLKNRKTENLSDDCGMSPLSEIHSSSIASHHPDNLDHLRISPNSNNIGGNNNNNHSVSGRSAKVNNMERDASSENGHESDNDSDVSVGQENESDSSPMSVNTVNKENRRRRDSVDFSEEGGLSNDSSRFASHSQLCSPVSAPPPDNERVPTILRPSPTRLHEEFLRSSQMYAEELMRQQMSIVAAAQASGFSTAATTTAQLTKLVTARTLLEEKMMGFRPAPSAINSQLHHRPLNPIMPSTHDPSALTSFRGIHNHLNAISQITQNLGSAMHHPHDMKFTSPSSPSDTSSQSPPVMHTPMHANHALHAAAMFMNNNLKDHQDNLKFSIDNILKADFGRRITEPLMKRSGGGAKGNASSKKHLKQLKNKQSRHSPEPAMLLSPQSSVGDRSDIGGAPMDLTAAEMLERESNKSVSPPPSGNTATGSSGSSSSDGKGPIVWPAWVYCTRYSDRPSSGKSSS